MSWKGTWCSVSMITNGLPEVSVAFEKSPRNISGAGTSARSALPFISRSESQENKKKVRLRPLYIAGSATGLLYQRPRDHDP